jgi:hypothetical protein
MIASDFIILNALVFRVVIFVNTVEEGFDIGFGE